VMLEFGFVFPGGFRGRPGAPAPPRPPGPT